MRTVVVRSHHENGIMVEGYGLRFHDYVLVHYSALSLDTEKISNSDCIDIFILDRKIPKTNYRAKIVRVWKCDTFFDNFNRYFDVTDFGIDNVLDCATFVLLFLQKDIVDVNDSISDYYQKLRDTAGQLKNVSQGMRITSVQFSSDSSCGKKKNTHENGIISYLFKCGTFFTVDLNVKPGSVIHRYSNKDEVEEFLGIVIFKDILPYPFQVFPVCISLKHLLTEACLSQRCKALRVTTSPRNYELEERLNGNFHYLVQCGRNIGSGSLIHEDIIITCAHILTEHISEGVIVYHNQVPYKAQVIFLIENNTWPDIALLRVLSESKKSASVIPMIKELPEISSNVFAVGTPYVKGWERSEPWLSSGRIISHTSGNLLVSCPVHQGFSGGAIVNLKGEMIGVICGKAYPLNDSIPPPRLTQSVGIFLMKDPIKRFITSSRLKKDREDLAESIRKIGRRLHDSKL